jgi:excisionase family DNA binding protein
MEIYDVPQLSEMLKVSKKAVRSYLITGRLKGRKVGKRWLVHEDAVREFLMNAERISTEQ